MAIRLVVTKGVLAGVSFLLEEGSEWSLGKDAKSDLQLAGEASLADEQMLFYKEDSLFLVKNLSPKIIVKVNGKELKEPVSLKDKDVVDVGKTTITVNIDKSEDLEDILIFNEEEESPLIHENSAESSLNLDEIEDELDVENLKNEEDSEPLVDKGKTGKIQDKGNKKAIDEKKTSLMEKDNMEYEEQPNNQEKLEKEVSKEEIRDKEIKDEETEGDEKGEQTEKSEEIKDEETEGDEKGEQTEKPEEIKDEEIEDDEKGEQTEKPEEKKENVSSKEKNLQTEEVKTQPSLSSQFKLSDIFGFDEDMFFAEKLPQDVENETTFVDFSSEARFLLKVLSGPNSGAEFGFEIGGNYILGSQAEACDVVFNDVSVSHKHVKLTIDSNGNMSLEDLSSKNGVLVEGQAIGQLAALLPNQIVTLGTTVFLIIDKQAPTETIVTVPLGFTSSSLEKNKKQDAAAEAEEGKEKAASNSFGGLIFALVIGGMAILFGIGTASLFHTKEIKTVLEDNFNEELEAIVKQFPGVRYTYNKNNSQVFLVGHVKNSINKSELLYKLNSLSFVKSIDDNLVDDEAVWQEMNIFLSKQPDFKSISMLSPEPGVFVLTGYLQTEEQAAALTDYLNIHFNYLPLLQNKVVVEKFILEQVRGKLIQTGYGGVNVSFMSGELVFTGHVNSNEKQKFVDGLDSFKNLPGVRSVKNFVISLASEEGVINLNKRCPNRYRVTGFSKHGDVNINVVVNGHILTRGDVLDGMKVISIQSQSIFLEKDGLKYKIDYNK